MNLSIILLRQLFAPVAILFAGFLAAELFQEFPEKILFLFSYLPYFFFAVSALLCVQFNQSRLLFSLVNIFLVYMVLHSVNFSILRLYEFVIIFWALLNIGILAQLPERSVISNHSVIKLMVLLVQVGLSWYFLVYQFLLAEQIMFSTQWREPPEWMNFSWLMLSISVLSLLATSVKFIVKPGPVLAAMLILIFMLISFLNVASEQSLVIACGISAGVLIFLAVLFDSHQMAYRDELTGLRSRRALNQYLTGLGRKYTIAMMDIDHFKKFNDNHGHDIGDQMLQLVASRIAKVTGGGTPFRYGGEEFTVVYPRKSIEDVLEHLEDLREAIEGYPLVVRAKDRPKEKPKGKEKTRQKKKSESKPKTLSCTISIGVASKGGDFKSPEQVIKGADLALYRAKKKGRNCVSE